MSIKSIFIIGMFGLVLWSGIAGAKTAAEKFHSFTKQSAVEIIIAAN